MRIVFLGTGAFGAPALRALRDAGREILAAISQPDRPAGRGKRVRPTPIHQTADELGITHFQTQDVNALSVSQVCGGGDIGVVAAFGQKIGPAVLRGFPRGCVNLHAALLPKYRGAAPIQWALINGEQQTGVSVFQLDQNWDAGPVWATRATPIAETETADELHDRLAELAADLIVETMRAIESGSARPVQQDPASASRAPKLTREDGVVDWTQPAQTVVRRIHGLWSWPAATCTFASRDGRRDRLQLARARTVDNDTPAQDHAPGSFLEDLSVQCGTGRVRLLEVKPAGGKLMDFSAFAHGRRIAPPDRLLPLDPS